MFVAAMKNVSLRAAPGLDTSLTSLRVTPWVSPSALVESTTPSKRTLVLVEIVTVVPCERAKNSGMETTRQSVNQLRSRPLPSREAFSAE